MGNRFLTASPNCKSIPTKEIDLDIFDINYSLPITISQERAYSLMAVTIWFKYDGDIINLFNGNLKLVYFYICSLLGSIVLRDNNDDFIEYEVTPLLLTEFTQNVFYYLDTKINNYCPKLIDFIVSSIKKIISHSDHNSDLVLYKMQIIREIIKMQTGTTFCAELGLGLKSLDELQLILTTKEEYSTYLSIILSAPSHQKNGQRTFKLDHDKYVCYMENIKEIDPEIISSFVLECYKNNRRHTTISEKICFYILDKFATEIMTNDLWYAILERLRELLLGSDSLEPEYMFIDMKKYIRNLNPKYVLKMIKYLSFEWKSYMTYVCYETALIYSSHDILIELFSSSSWKRCDRDMGGSIGIYDKVRDLLKFDEELQGKFTVYYGSCLDEQTPNLV